MHCTVSDRLYFHDPPREVAQALMKHFRIRNPAYAAAEKFSPHGMKYSKIPEYLYAGEFDGVDVALPRCVSIPMEIIPAKYRAEVESINVTDNRVKALQSFPPLRITLNPIQDAIFASFNATDPYDRLGHLIVVGTSGGKTIAMLNLARACRHKTLILVHRNLIKETAWITDIDKAFGGSTVPGIWQGSSRIVGEHFTIAMCQTVARMQAGPRKAFLSQFGTMLLDEAHICPQPYISNIVDLCPAVYRIGGTATPDVAHQKHLFLHWAFGKPSYVNKDSESENQLPIAEARFEFTKFTYAADPDVPLEVEEVVRAMGDNALRNQQIVRCVETDLRSGHHVLLTTSRVEHAMVLHSLLSKHDPALLTGGRVFGRVQHDLWVAELMSGKKRLAVATYQTVFEGSSFPPIDRLHIAHALGNRNAVTQLAGRVRRKSPDTGKTDARLTVYVDGNVPVLRRRVVHVMLPALKALKVRGLDGVFFT